MIDQIRDTYREVLVAAAEFVSVKTAHAWVLRRIDEHQPIETEAQARDAGLAALWEESDVLMPREQTAFARLDAAIKSYHAAIEQEKQSTLTIIASVDIAKP